jgi:hypothetical protein
VVQGGLVVAATVGTQPGVCADTTSLEAPENSQVYFCVTLHNTGAVTLTGFVLTALDQTVPLPSTVSVPPGELLQFTNTASPLLGPVTVTEPLTATLGVTAQAGDGVLGQLQAQSAPVVVTLKPTGLDTTDEPVGDKRIYLPWITR